MQDLAWFRERMEAVAKAIASGSPNDKDAQAAMLDLGATVLHDLHRIADGLSKDEPSRLLHTPGKPTVTGVSQRRDPPSNK